MPSRRESPRTRRTRKGSRRDDLGRLVESAGEERASARETQALLRELTQARLGTLRRWPEFAPPGVTDLELAREWILATR